jgi:Zn-dependent oligopeptidase
VADVVEVPSTLMEYFAYEPSVLKTLTGHYLTNQPLPDALLAPLFAKVLDLLALLVQKYKY